MLIILSILAAISQLPLLYSFPRCQINGAAPYTCTTQDDWRYNLLCRGLGQNPNPGQPRTADGYIHDALIPGNSKASIKIKRSAIILLNNMGEELTTVYNTLTQDAQRLAFLRKWESLLNTIGTQLYGPAGWNSSFTCGLAANQAVQCGDKINGRVEACETASTYLLAFNYANANQEAIENELASQDISLDQLASQNISLNEEINEEANELVTEINQASQGGLASSTASDLAI